MLSKMQSPTPGTPISVLQQPPNSRCSLYVRARHVTPFLPHRAVYGITWRKGAGRPLVQILGLFRPAGPAFGRFALALM